MVDEMRIPVPGRINRQGLSTTACHGPAVCIPFLGEMALRVPAPSRGDATDGHDGVLLDTLPDESVHRGMTRNDTLAVQRKDLIPGNDGEVDIIGHGRCRGGQFHGGNEPQALVRCQEMQNMAPHIRVEHPVGQFFFFESRHNKKKKERISSDHFFIVMDILMQILMKIFMDTTMKNETHNDHHSNQDERSPVRKK